MPYTEKQHKLFEAAAHNPAIAKAHNIPQAKAAEMAGEGVKDCAKKIKVRFRKEEARADAEHWITVHPNGRDNKGSPALINGAGQIIGGAGGKLNGRFVSPKSKSADRPGTEEQHAPAIWLGPAKPEEPGNGGANTTTPEAPKAEEKPPIDAQQKAMEDKLVKAKEVLEASREGYPPFMVKEMESDIARQEKALEDYKAKLAGNTPEEKPEAKPEAKPEIKPEPPAEKPVEEVKPEPPAPEPTPPIAEPPKAEEAPMTKAGREGDEIAAKAKTFEDVESAYKKYREGLDVAMRTSQANTDEAKDLHKKMMAMREEMSRKSFEVSENAKTLEDHKKALEIQRKMYDMTRALSINNAHAKAHNEHLKAIKKFGSDKAKAEKKAAKAEEKRTGIKPASLALDEKYAKASVEEIASNLQSKYGIGFVSKPDTKHLLAKKAELNKKIQESGPHEEGWHEAWREQQNINEQIRSMERYARVKHFNAVDINAKTQSAKNARKTVAHIEATLDGLTAKGYDIKKVLEVSKVTIATGTTGKFGGLAWGAGAGERFMCVDANKYFDAEREEAMRTAEESRQAKGLPRWNAGQGLASVAIHELAHAAGMNPSRNSPERLNEILTRMEPNFTRRNEWIKRNISEYGASNIKETDAELAALVLSDGYKRGTLPKEVEDHVDWLFMKKGG